MEAGPAASAPTQTHAAHPPPPTSAAPSSISTQTLTQSPPTRQPPPSATSQSTIAPAAQAVQIVQLPPTSKSAQASAPAHPPPPTFAHANGPDLSSLDFRNRFSHQLTRPVPSFSPAAFDHPRAVAAGAPVNGTSGENRQGSTDSDSAIDPELGNGKS